MLIRWIRQLLGLTIEQQYNEFSMEHYAAFEAAVAESDVEVWVYEHNVCNRFVVLKGSPFHSVTVGNLVQFYKLNRKQRRALDAHIVVGDKAFNDDSNA